MAQVSKPQKVTVMRRSTWMMRFWKKKKTRLEMETLVFFWERREWNGNITVYCRNANLISSWPNHFWTTRPAPWLCYQPPPAPKQPPALRPPPVLPRAARRMSPGRRRRKWGRAAGWRRREEGWWTWWSSNSPGIFKKKLMEKVRFFSSEFLYDSMFFSLLSWPLPGCESKWVRQGSLKFPISRTSSNTYVW